MGTALIKIIFIKPKSNKYIFHEFYLGFLHNGKKLMNDPCSKKTESSCYF